MRAKRETSASCRRRDINRASSGVLRRRCAADGIDMVAVVVKCVKDRCVDEEGGIR